MQKGEKIMLKNEATKKFFARLDALPDPNLTNVETIRKLSKRYANEVVPEIKRIEREQKKSMERAFTKAVS
jgi:hypothetical protein